MNNMRKAAEAGGRVVRVIQRDRKTGKVLHERVNDARRVKRELGLSGRQLKKLRKQIGREDREEQRLIMHGNPNVPPPQGIIHAAGITDAHGATQ